MLSPLFNGLGRVCDALFMLVLDLNLSQEVEVVPEPYPTTEGKPSTQSQTWSNPRN